MAVFGEVVNAKTIDGILNSLQNDPAAVEMAMQA